MDVFLFFKNDFINFNRFIWNNFFFFFSFQKFGVWTANEQSFQKRTKAGNRIPFEFLCIETARARPLFPFSERWMDNGEQRGNKFVNTMDGAAQ